MPPGLQKCKWYNVSFLFISDKGLKNISYSMLCNKFCEEFEFRIINIIYIYYIILLKNMKLHFKNNILFIQLKLKNIN